MKGKSVFLWNFVWNDKADTVQVSVSTMKEMSSCSIPPPFTHLGKQWAAVTTKSGEIRTPPQVWTPPWWRDSCQGHWPGLATLPPMIRDVDGCLPQSGKKRDG